MCTMWQDLLVEQGMEDKKLHAMTNEEVIAYLTPPLKGVGRWTVEMLLMFALGREDVFADDDLGIQNAMIGIYKLDRTERKHFVKRVITDLPKMESLPYICITCTCGGGRIITRLKKKK